MGRDFPPYEKTHCRISIGTMDEMQRAVKTINTGVMLNGTLLASAGVGIVLLGGGAASGLPLTPQTRHIVDAARRVMASTRA